jgi:hypothetical protein
MLQAEIRALKLEQQRGISVKSKLDDLDAENARLKTVLSLLVEKFQLISEKPLAGVSIEGCLKNQRTPGFRDELQRDLARKIASMHVFSTLLTLARLS